MKILMVCLGNICRSPLAEEILRSKLNDHFQIDSAGIGAWHVGQKPDVRSIQVAKQHGLDISHQRARQFTTEDLDDFDLIYAMDKSVYDEIIGKAETEIQLQKIKCILSELQNPNSLDVPDPYYGDEKDFEMVFQILDEVTDVIAKKL